MKWIRNGGPVAPCYILLASGTNCPNKVIYYPRERHSIVWNESGDCRWEKVKIPPHLTDEEAMALLLVEYRLLNSAGGA